MEYRLRIMDPGRVVARMEQKRNKVGGEQAGLK